LRGSTPLIAKQSRFADGIDTLAHAGLARQFITIDNVELLLLVNNLPLDCARQVIPNLVRPISTVEEESRARLGGLQHLDALKERKLVASHEVGFRYEIAGVQRLRTETQIRSGDGAGLFKIVDEIALCMILTNSCWR
jgi:hypothetical protein